MNKYRRVPYWRRWGHREALNKMELLTQSEGEEENVASDDVDGDENYDSRYLFCKEVEEEEYDLCSGCDEKLFAHFVQPCGHMICADFVKISNCQLR